MFKDASTSISTYIIPLLCVLYIQYPILRNLIIDHMVPISIIGIVNAVLQKRTWFEKAIILCGHLIFFLLLKKYKPGAQNVGQTIKLATLLFSIAIILSIPIWTYELSRCQMVTMYSVVYLLAFKLKEIPP